MGENVLFHQKIIQFSSSSTSFVSSCLMHTQFPQPEAEREVFLRGLPGKAACSVTAETRTAGTRLLLLPSASGASQRQPINLAVLPRPLLTCPDTPYGDPYEDITAISSSFLKFGFTV